jgi:hypothetical protein
MYKAQAAPYDYPTVHIQIEGNPSEFSSGTRRTYGAAFNVQDADLHDAVSDAERTLPSQAGTFRKYAPVTVERANNSTLTIGLVVPELFDVEYPAPVQTPIV